MEKINDKKLAEMVQLIDKVWFGKCSPASWEQQTLEEIQSLGVDPVIVLREAAKRFALNE